MNILFISSACSENVFNNILQGLSDKSGIAIQKFHRLLLEGFASDKSNSVQTLSTLPISPGIHEKRLWSLKSDTDKGVSFNYVPIINFPLVKNLIVFFYSFFRFLFWTFPKKDEGKLIICDVLSLTISTAAQFAFRIRKIAIIGLVTDVPGINVFNENILKRVFSKINRFFLTRYNGYILLTAQMNAVVNPLSKPFIIIEGMVDYNMREVDNRLEKKFREKVLIYAGGLYERYGIKKLIQAFVKLEGVDLRLYLYGEGPMVPDLQNYMDSDDRIIYRGVAANVIVVADQIAATLLINPRPSTEEFSKFSFPSKNMEYMVSGTPLVTTRLPGMPEEYLPFVYLFEGESVQEMYLTLNQLVNKPKEELNSFGFNAKEFVLKEKNNNIQAEKIKSFFAQEIK